MSNILSGFPAGRKGVAAAALLVIGLWIAGGGRPARAWTSPVTVQMDTLGSQEPGSVAAAEAREDYFRDLYLNFYSNYRLGPGDVIAIRVLREPDYSQERAAVSPVGFVYHPLIGDIPVGGLTLDQLKKSLVLQFSEYLVQPTVSVALVESKSAKIGVLGEVLRPGIVVMSMPMTVIDAIIDAGGFSSGGSKSGVTLLRQMGDGSYREMKLDVKRVLEGKADPEANMMLRPGDTIIVHSSLKKKLSYIPSFTGFATFLMFLWSR